MGILSCYPNYLAKIVLLSISKINPGTNKLPGNLKIFQGNLKNIPALLTI